MKDRYDGSPSKEAAMGNTRQKRYESEHSAKDAFVKRQQGQLDRYAGKKPRLEGEAFMFNAYMCNDGEHAQKLAREITAGLDKVAFPVDGEGNDS